MINPYDYCVGNIDPIDFQAIAKLARNAHRILEFGSGGSTQLLAMFSPPDAHVWSVDTDKAWQGRTSENLAKQGARERVDFLEYKRWKHDLCEALGPRPWFDLIFVDGLESERAVFANESWPLLMPTGVCAWHDCRWGQITGAALQLCANNFLELERIDVGMDNSNVLAIHKKPLMHAPCPPPPPLEDWMTANSFEPPPVGWPAKRLVP